MVHRGPAHGLEINEERVAADNGQRLAAGGWRLAAELEQWWRIRNRPRLYVSIVKAFSLSRDAAYLIATKFPAPFTSVM